MARPRTYKSHLTSAEVRFDLVQGGRMLLRTPRVYEFVPFDSESPSAPDFSRFRHDWDLVAPATRLAPEDVVEVWTSHQDRTPTHWLLRHSRTDTWWRLDRPKVTLKNYRVGRLDYDPYSPATPTLFRKGHPDEPLRLLYVTGGHWPQGRIRPPDELSRVAATPWSARITPHGNNPQYADLEAWILTPPEAHVQEVVVHDLLARTWGFYRGTLPN